MKKNRWLGVWVLLAMLSSGQVFSQKGDIAQVVTHKWKVIWYSDNGVVKNMEDKKQQLVLRADGSGEMFMLGSKVGDVIWSVAKGKNKINFQDDPTTPAYLVKVSKFKSGSNMLFTGMMPNGEERKVYFEVLSGK